MKNRNLLIASNDIMIFLFCHFKKTEVYVAIVLINLLQIGV